MHDNEKLARAIERLERLEHDIYVFQKYLMQLRDHVGQLAKERAGGLGAGKKWFLALSEEQQDELRSVYTLLSGDVEKALDASKLVASDLREGADTKATKQHIQQLTARVSAASSTAGELSAATGGKVFVSKSSLLGAFRALKKSWRHRYLLRRDYNRTEKS